MENPVHIPIVPFEKLLDLLLNTSVDFPEVHLHRFSDLEGPEFDLLIERWSEIDPKRRVDFLSKLLSLLKEDTLLLFDNLARFALSDPDPGVRILGILLLSECEEKTLVPVFTKMMHSDPDTQVRAAATGALGLFVYLGEIEDSPEKIKISVEESLFATYRSNVHDSVRQEALEALGFSSHPDIEGMILTAFQSGDLDWLCSSITAMGRSADLSWENRVLEAIKHPIVQVQICAIEAAGKLELISARQPLFDLLDDIEELPDDVIVTTVWALSQIGGPGVREKIIEVEALMADDDNQDIFEEVLDSLSFTEELESLALLDIDPDLIDLVDNHNDFLQDDES